MHLLLVAWLSALPFTISIDVYLNKKPFHHSSPTLQQASYTLSHHLGVDVFESLHGVSTQRYNNEFFVGEGPYNVLLLTMDEQDAKAVLPPSIQPSFKLFAAPSSAANSISSLVSTYSQRAFHAFTSVYNDDYTGNPEAVLSFFESAVTPSFAAIELTSLSALRQHQGSASEEYKMAVSDARTLFDQAFMKPEVFHVAILTFPTLRYFEKREQEDTSTHPSPREPIASVSTCFTSPEACSNGTNSCSERGQCHAATKSGRTCYMCVCDVTRTGNGSSVKTDKWVGESCERKDVSSQFVLLTGTVVVLFVLVFGSVSLLSSVGTSELPSTLLATAAHPKRD